jgi:uncharacterized protein
MRGSLADPRPIVYLVQFDVRRPGGYAMPKPEAGQPVGLRERIAALDVLRGFAMVGVLVAYCLWSLGNAPEEQWSATDRLLGEAAAFAVDGKFYIILATLFGFGFAIQLNRASSDAAAVDTYCRRLSVLAGIGLVHALFLRNGDILLPYALTGFVLVLFRKASDRTLVLSAILVLLFQTAIQASWSALGLPEAQRPQLEDANYLTENAAWLHYWFVTAPFNWPVNLTLFLFGLLAGRRQLVGALSQRPGRLKLLALGGLLLGAILYFVHASYAGPGAGKVTAALLSLLFTFHCWAMSGAYAALLLLALRTGIGSRLLMPLAALGRLALTNYLLQAAIAVPLCIAFGWFNRFTPTWSLLFAAAILAFQLPFSMWWAKRYQFGPAEWLWRLLTYQRLPSMRLSPGAVGPL